MYLKLLVGFGSREVAEAGIQKLLLGGTRGDSGLDEREWLGGLTGGEALGLAKVSGIGTWGRGRAWAWAAHLCGIWSLEKLSELWMKDTALIGNWRTC